VRDCVGEDLAVRDPPDTPIAHVFCFCHKISGDLPLDPDAPLILPGGAAGILIEFADGISTRREAGRKLSRSEVGPRCRIVLRRVTVRKLRESSSERRADRGSGARERRCIAIALFGAVVYDAETAAKD